jgi:hypothetical protein
MQGYLFPLQRTGSPDPYKVLIETILPSSRQSVFIIDPSPPDDLVDILIKLDNPLLNKRLLVRRDILNAGEALPPDIMKMETRERISCSNIHVRAINRLSARLAIIDDSATIISGEYGLNLNWGVTLNPIDSQPILDYWNAVYQDAYKVSDSYAINVWDQYLEKFWSGRISPGDIIALYNNRGSFVAIHVRIFSGFRQMTLYPLSDSAQGISKGPSIRWKLIHSRHYKNLGRLSTRIHGLKSRSVIRETPAGSYLLRSDRRIWDAMFQERNVVFKEQVADYLDRHYETMRDEAFQSLDSGYKAVLNEIKKDKQLLPLIDNRFVKDEIQEIFHKHFPDKNKLLFACQAGYILYGLHPEASDDRKLMDSLSSTAATNVLL